MVGTNRKTHISFPDMTNPYYHDITTGIADGSLLLDEILLSQGLNFGEVNSNKFEVQMYDISDVSGQRIVVWQTDEDTTDTEVPIFTGYVDSSKQNHSAYYREIVAYDAFYTTANENISAWWKSFWETHPDGVSLGTLRVSLITHMGLSEVQAPESGYINNDVIIHALPEEQTLTFGVLLKMICELQAMIPNMNRYGVVEYLGYPTGITFVGDNVNTRDSLFEEFRTEVITGVWVYDIDDNLVAVGGPNVGNNPYKIQGNLLVKGVENLESVAENVYFMANMIQYTPGNTKFIVSDPTLMLGSFLNVGTNESGSIFTYIFENHLSGPLLIDQEIVAGGDLLLEETSNYNSGISSIRNKVSSDQTQYFMIANTEAIHIDDGENQKIIDARFTSNAQTIAIFHAEILLDCETTSGSEVIEGETYDTYNDNDIIVTYKYNDEVLDHYRPKEIFTDGDHILHLLYYIPIQEARLEKFEVWMSCSGGSLDIMANGVNASIYGQNIVGRDDFSGLIEAVDEFNTFNLLNLVNTFTDSASVSELTPEKRTLNDNYTLYSFTGLLNTFTDTAGADKDMIEMYNGDGISDVHCGINENNTWIGPGYVISADIYGTDHIIVNADTGVEYLVSFNDGPWVGFINGSWVEDITMTKSQLEAITQADWSGYPFKLKATLSNDAIISSIIFVDGYVL